MYMDAVACNADPMTGEQALNIITQVACNEDFRLNAMQMVELLSCGLSFAQWDDTRMFAYDALNKGIATMSDFATSASTLANSADDSDSRDMQTDSQSVAQVKTDLGLFEDADSLSAEDLNNLAMLDPALLSEKEKEALASDMAIFLRRLHGISVPLSEKPFCEIFEDKRKRYLEDQEQLLEVLENRKLLNAPLQKNIQTIYEHIGQNQELFNYAACLVHNDFSSSNMVFRHNRLYGVIDFGDVIVGDPDNDFLCLLDCSMDDFGKDFGRKVLRHYGHRNPQLAERKAEINDAYWPIQQVLLGVQREDRSLFCKGYRELLAIDPDAFIL